MPAQFTIPLIVVVPGQIIAASLWNNEWNNIFVNLTPLGVDTYSNTDSQMQTATDPYPSGSTSRPTSLAGELERLRFIIDAITGNTYWYQHPVISISALNALFPLGPTNLGPNSVTDTQIAASAIGAGLTGGGGSQISAVVDNSTIDINGSNQIEVKANGITLSQLATALVGSGLSTSGSSIIVYIDNTTIDLNGSGRLEVKANSIGTAQINTTGLPPLVGLKSIQTVNASTVTVSTGQTQGNSNTTIASVNTAKVALCVVAVTIASSANTAHISPMVSVSLTNATTLHIVINTTEATAGGAISYNVTVTILEFN
jgi:hypothetical protein